MKTQKEPYRKKRTKKLLLSTNYSLYTKLQTVRLSANFTSKKQLKTQLLPKKIAKQESIFTTI